MPCTGDLLSFAKGNVDLLHSMLRSNISQVSVGYNNPSSWCDYMKMRKQNPSVYNFIRSKLQLSDSEISDLTQYIITLTTDSNAGVEADKIAFLTDFICNVFINQFDLNIKKVDK